MTTELTITSERIDDFPLLLAVIMLQLGLHEIFDHHIKRYGLHQGLSWGWIVSIWLAHLLTKSDHRKQPMQAWVKQASSLSERVAS
jgi:transposase